MAPHGKDLSLETDGIANGVGEKNKTKNKLCDCLVTKFEQEISVTFINLIYIFHDEELDLDLDGQREERAVVFTFCLLLRVRRLLGWCLVVTWWHFLR